MDISLEEAAGAKAHRTVYGESALLSMPAEKKEVDGSGGMPGCIMIEKCIRSFRCGHARSPSTSMSCLEQMDGSRMD